MFCFNATAVLEHSILRTSNGVAHFLQTLCAALRSWFYILALLHARALLRSDSWWQESVRECVITLSFAASSRLSDACAFCRKSVQRCVVSGKSVQRCVVSGKKCSTLCCLRSSRCTSCPTTVSGGRWASQHVVGGTQWSTWTCSPVSWLPWLIPKWEVQMIILDFLFTCSPPWWVVFNWVRGRIWWQWQNWKGGNYGRLCESGKDQCSVVY